MFISKAENMRAVTVVLVMVGLVGCSQPRVPESATIAPSGFDNYNDYLRANSDPGAPVIGETTGDPIVGAPISGTALPGRGFSTDAAAAAIDAADGTTSTTTGTAPLTAIEPVQTADATLPAADRSRDSLPAGIAQDAGEMHAGISDEQDFEAVKSRESIESDMARIEANRAQYVVIQPSELPTRPGDTGPNIVEFALATTNPPGAQLYTRSAIRLGSSNAACGKFASPDQAQQAFLAAGGPDRDRKGLDPDGDGFACYWDPRPFRTALQ